MAQGYLCAVADRIIRLLHSEDIKSQLVVDDKLLGELETTILKLRPKLLHAEKNKLFYDYELTCWLMRLEDAVYDTDNLMEVLSTEALLHKLRTNTGNKMANLQEIMKIKKRLDGIAADKAGAIDFEERTDVGRLQNGPSVELSSLKLSFADLPSPLKHCFAYCSLFPEDCKIDVQTLIKLWMAQAFIEPSEESLEDAGYEYFLKLLEKLFFEEDEKDARGRVTKCKIHPLARDLAIYVADNLCHELVSQRITSDYEINRRTFHVSFSAEVIPTALIHADKVRSILFPSQSRQRYRRMPDNTIFDTILNFKFLRALDMHALGIEIVPYSIGKLKLLKYLDLSENGDITELPNSLTKLLNLQTLKLSSCFGLKRLPADFKNLINLRHLEIDGCYNLTRLPQGIGELTNLQTLSQVVASEEASVTDGNLNEVKKLKKLGDEFHIKNLGCGKDDMDKYLDVIKEVRSLSIEWKSHAPASDQDEKPLTSNMFSSAIEELSLYGFRDGTLFTDGYPSKLVKLSLRKCVNLKTLPSQLDQLSNLKVLVLDDIPNLEYVSEINASSSTTVFPSLQELWLTELPRLKIWWKRKIEELPLPSFHCLSKLVIQDCPILESMPLFPTLEAGLVLDTTCWEPFQLTMSMSMKQQDEASSSSSNASSRLSKLKNLCLVGIDDFKAEEIKWDMLKSLRFLRFDCLPVLEILPEGLQQVTSLEELHVWRSGLNEIPKWIGKLKKLVIRVCPTLKSLPEEIRFLHTLEIEDCSTLLLRCEKDIGADWSKIADIKEKRLGRSSAT